ncbi:MAG: hypothetical protein IPF92_29655 [Myxococcales bacterium]|nr:hypothetical protein [Myxococcales bacterium]
MTGGDGGARGTAGGGAGGRGGDTRPPVAGASVPAGAGNRAGGGGGAAGFVRLRGLDLAADAGTVVPTAVVVAP